MERNLTPKQHLGRKGWKGNCGYGSYDSTQWHYNPEAGANLLYSDGVAAWDQEHKNGYGVSKCLHPLTWQTGGLITFFSDASTGELFCTSWGLIPCGRDKELRQGPNWPAPGPKSHVTFLLTGLTVFRIQSLNSCVLLAKLHNFSKPQFLLL